MDEWNAIVDGYIAESTDKRERFDIELASKIGANGGALYKKCDYCHKVQGRDYHGNLKCCSGCKLIVYCSSVCQAKDWPRHKAECKTESHKEQELRTQQVVLRCINQRPTKEELQNFDLASRISHARRS
ncbi:uncharacterized protein PHACADRAFT_202808 [Phanerochaete carnosa HHB-10118-sp]|uniref:MYND-type domain-containing protein n=1 Tax=Phanerochaete carnosa (strain HHB-10118-sp) TaxID=650164 RepID=K5UG49_PHACS|nr:uncharacterized protein PHACADRAFT_202808 [Phanerochaete carnosa HHB-10118-sp]EKM48441.1 hypothetical protein PHACADRAFT_202808 [Phanerochaete carnosa HHB-10118-sp]